MSKIYRFEFKYEIDSRQAYFIEKDIKKFGMKPDLNILTGDGEYTVTSLYWDSHNFSDYGDKTGGLQKRKKFRLRIYEPYLDKSEFVWLEIKNRFGSQNTKSRVRLSRSEFNKLVNFNVKMLIEREWNYKDLSKKDEILRNLIKSSIKPKVVVRYRRKAFVNDQEDVRITFDHGLEASTGLNLNDPVRMVNVNPHKLVMEVKFCYIMPYWFKDIIKAYGLKADTYSKYEKSLEALHRYNPLTR